MHPKLSISVVLHCAVAALGGAAHAEFFDSGGVRLHYSDEGHGTPVLLIHGYAGNISWWRDQGVIEGLVDAGYRVIAYDNRGHGESAKPRTTEAYGMNMVGDAERLLDHLSIKKAHVVGYSMGAAIANKFCAERPERLLSVTLAGYGHPPLPGRYSIKLVEEIEANLQRMNLLDGNDAEALARVSLGWKEWGVDATELRRNQVPALALIGEEDGFLSDTQKLASEMSGLTDKILPGDHGSLPAEPRFLQELTDHLGKLR